MKVAELFEGLHLLSDVIRKFKLKKKSTRADVAKWLEENKDMVMKHLLSEYKDSLDFETTSGPWQRQAIWGLIAGIREAGLHWPELDALEKSMKK